MAIKYTIIPELKLVSVIGSAVIGYSDLSEHFDTLAMDPRYQPPMKKLIDYRNIWLLALSDKELALCNQKKITFKERFSGEQCAIVSTGNLNYRTACKLCAKSDPLMSTTRSFKDLETAFNWLELEDISDKQLLLTADQQLNRAGTRANLRKYHS